MSDEEMLALAEKWHASNASTRALVKSFHQTKARIGDAIAADCIPITFNTAQVCLDGERWIKFTDKGKAYFE